ncbi:LOW QUALITY PROTEIN: NFATC2-interacting protein [Menidia menidia]
MAEAVCDPVSGGERQPQKRRRLLDPAAIAPVPVYSNKVSSSLRLKPSSALLARQNPDGEPDGALWAELCSRIPPPSLISLSDSEEESEPQQNPAEPAEWPPPPCPSPPPPQSPVHKRSRKVTKKIKTGACGRPAPCCPRGPGGPAPPRRPPPPDDDIILLSPPPPDPDREIPLKIRCRDHIHKIPVLPSTRVGAVAARLAVLLAVPAPRLLLLREEAELPQHATVGQLGLSIADIIECVVMSAEGAGTGDDIIRLRLQSRDRDSTQEFTVHREAPLGPVLSGYVSKMAAGSTARFLFDGAMVTGSQTPAQLDMEDGDLIEVWT